MEKIIKDFNEANRNTTLFNYVSKIIFEALVRAINVNDLFEKEIKKLCYSKKTVFHVNSINSKQCSFSIEIVDMENKVYLTLLFENTGPIIEDVITVKDEVMDFRNDILCILSNEIRKTTIIIENKVIKTKYYYFTTENNYSEKIYIGGQYSIKHLFCRKVISEKIFDKWKID